MTIPEGKQIDKEEISISTLSISLKAKTNSFFSNSIILF